jgi:hypothetical protein
MGSDDGSLFLMDPAEQVFHLTVETFYNFLGFPTLDKGSNSSNSEYLLNVKLAEI